MTLGKLAAIGAATFITIGAASAQTNPPTPMTPPAQSPSSPADTSPMPPQRSPDMAPSTTSPAPIVRDTAPSAKFSSITEMNAKQLVGKSVYNAAGDRIGEVDDVVVSKAGAQTAAVIGVGGFLGIGEKKVALPVNQLQVQDNKIVALGLSEDSAKRLPEYRKDDWNKAEAERPVTR